MAGTAAEHNAAQLWRELAAHGFGGRPSTVRAWAAARRETPSCAASPQAAVAKWQLPSRRGLARLLMAATETLEEVERNFVAKLLHDAPDIAHALAVAKRLRAVLRREGEQDLDGALAAAKQTAPAGFAASLRKDLAAVQAALKLPWTTSPGEGRIDRIKTIKRSMYGRAGFTLLRA